MRTAKSYTQDKAQMRDKTKKKADEAGKLNMRVSIFSEKSNRYGKSNSNSPKNTEKKKLKKIQWDFGTKGKSPKSPYSPSEMLKNKPTPEQAEYYT